MLELIKSLCSINGVSGRESDVRDFIISKLPDNCSYHVDNIGNLIVNKKGALVPEHKLMVCAHMDEVGMIITYITEDGFLKFNFVGGVDPAVLIGRRVILESGVPGVISLKHIHLCTKEERGTIPDVEKLCIDIGAHTKAEAEKFVSLGDVAFFDSDFREFGTDNRFIKAKALDDRIGCALMLKLINSDLKYDTDFVFTVQEEIGARGAQTAAFAVNPDVCIVLETTTAGDICGVEGEKKACSLGMGPVISYMDRGTVYDHELYKKAMSLALENSIPAQTKTLIAGGNDSQAVQAAGSGTRVMAVSVPCRYLHSPVCVIDKEDIVSCEKLLDILMEQTW